VLRSGQRPYGTLSNNLDLLRNSSLAFVIVFLTRSFPLTFNIGQNRPEVFWKVAFVPIYTSTAALLFASFSGAIFFSGVPAFLASTISNWTRADAAFREVLPSRDHEIDEVQRSIEAVLSYSQRRKIEDALETTNRLRVDPLIVEKSSLSNLLPHFLLPPSTVPKL
jgi:predicted RNase H-like nuclease